MRRLVCSLLFLGLVACGESGDSATSQVAPESFSDHSCAACGMFVREQPSPRGQVVHRDGTREYFCAIGDMVTYLEAPSPHGEAVGVFVEVMPADAEPASRDTAPRPWAAAAEAGFVVGIERSVMGEPVMTFVDAPTARAAAERLRAQALDWPGLRQRLTRVGANAGE